MFCGYISLICIGKVQSLMISDFGTLPVTLPVPKPYNCIDEDDGKTPILMALSIHEYHILL